MVIDLLKDKVNSVKISNPVVVPKSSYAEAGKTTAFS